MEISSKLCTTIRARKLKFWDNVHYPLCVTCHMSCVMCHMTCVTFHMSHVICNIKKKCWASRWRVCYQRGLARLVYYDIREATTKFNRPSYSRLVSSPVLQVHCIHWRLATPDFLNVSSITSSAGVKVSGLASICCFDIDWLFGSNFFRFYW